MSKKFFFKVGLDHTGRKHCEVFDTSELESVTKAYFVDEILCHTAFKTF